MAEPRIAVEVVFADGGSAVVRRRAQVPRGSTVAEAITASGITPSLPQGAVDPARLGIFGRKATADQIVRDGDRIEICRPLLFDPMEARRRRSR
ncbi:MAG: RnfH family protein [Rhodanobacter sp.]|jgi:putative ubiquitin-RnfH superfamily antitoxin RatB of RatAB toxin-antitoxin module